MDLDELNKKLVKLKGVYLKEKNQLIHRYAMSNNHYKSGDKVTDHMGGIVIERIEIVAMSFSNDHECIYYGLELTKRGVPKKSGNKRFVYQSNILVTKK